MIHIVAFTHLVRSSMTAAIDSDNAIAFCQEEEHLVIPVIGTQRPAVVEDNGLSLFRTPVFVVNVDAVFRGYECHTADSSVKNNTTPKV